MASYSREHAILAKDLLAFVQEAQPAEWATFKRWHNGASEDMFAKRVAKQLDTHGTLHLLRRGFKNVDAEFYLCQFKHAHQKNPKLLELYARNRLTVVRQGVRSWAAFTAMDGSRSGRCDIRRV